MDIGRSQSYVGRGWLERGESKCGVDVGRSQSDVAQTV